MANQYKPDFNNPYRVDPLYARMTLPRETSDSRFGFPSVRDIFGKLSQTSQFKVTLYFGDTTGGQDPDKDVNAWLATCGVLGDYRGLRYEFLCNETALPGSSFSTMEEFGTKQGISETFANRRVFDPITMTFYVDAEYGVIRLFEEWMNFINPLYSETAGTTNNGRPITGNTGGQIGQFDDYQFYRFRYPKSYKRNIAITKFERNFVLSDLQTDFGDPFAETPDFLTYYMINAYPINLTALPVTYEGSTITKTTVTFNYDRYVTLKHKGSSTNNSYSSYSQPNTTADGRSILMNTPAATSSQTNYNNVQFGQTANYYDYVPSPGLGI